MSFWKTLFGGGTSEAETASTRSTEHKGFRIDACPYLESGQYQLAGLISKDIDGTRREYRFVRADRFATAEEAAEFALIKGRLIIDEQGDRLLK